jgi:ribosomal protein S18 acetylase RimI-like enzyme
VQGIEVREVRPEEFEAAGRLVVEAYRSLGVPQSASYEAEMADVGARVMSSTVLVALADGRLAGCATFASAGSPFYELDDPDGATIRMLGVAADARGRGVGEALVQACVQLARAAGARRVWLHTEPFMQAAHRLYARLGFARAPERDWRFEEEGEPDVILLAYVLELGS